MRSSTKLFLLALSALTLILVTESRRTMPSKEELEKLLNHINKPAIKSFQTTDGDIFDCIDIKKQRAFDHPLLKNHSIQLKPTTLPKWTRDNNNSSQKSRSLPFRQDDNNISCPLGTVIIKRTTLEDLLQFERIKSLGFNYPTSKDQNVLNMTGRHFAIAVYHYDICGAWGNINIWDPHVEPDQYSLASVSIQNGLGASLQSISAGWIVSPKLNQHHSSLFTYWTADGYNGTGCFNILCPGFVQVSSKFPLGALAKPVSTYRGPQYELEVTIMQDFITYDWWLVIRGEIIGYWPSALFHVDGLAKGASRAYWGGEVFNADKQRISPKMGSGHFPQEGFSKAAYVDDLRVVERITKDVRIPPPKALGLFANSPKCYSVIPDPEGGKYWSSYNKKYWSSPIYFGGPGGRCTND